MITKAKSLISILFILAMISFNSSFAQETKIAKDDKSDKAISELVQSLSSKLNLSEDQQNDARAALTQYKEESANVKGDAKKMDDAVSKTNQQIESFLNPTQKTEWTSVKEAWWKDVNTKLHGQMPKLEEKQKNETY
jgi:uncharacterized NAD(P)/FAD-binding protein YdhS